MGIMHTLPLAGGELFRLLEEQGCLGEPAARFYAACALAGLAALHRRGIAYRVRARPSRSRSLPDCNQQWFGGERQPICSPANKAQWNWLPECISSIHISVCRLCVSAELVDAPLGCDKNKQLQLSHMFMGACAPTGPQTRELAAGRGRVPQAGRLRVCETRRSARAHVHGLRHARLPGEAQITQSWTTTSSQSSQSYMHYAVQLTLASRSASMREGRTRIVCTTPDYNVKCKTSTSSRSDMDWRHICLAVPLSPAKPGKPSDVWSVLPSITGTLTSIQPSNFTRRNTHAHFR